MAVIWVDRKADYKVNQILGRDKEIEAICRALESRDCGPDRPSGYRKVFRRKAVCSKQQEKKVGWHTGSRMTSTSSLDTIFLYQKILMSWETGSTPIWFTFLMKHRKFTEGMPITSEECWKMLAMPKYWS